MIRHFLGVMFWSFIGVVVFVNLYQYSNAVLPFESTGYYRQDYSNTYFGFTSVFRFVSDLGSNSVLDSGVSIFKAGFSVVKMFSIDEIVNIFDNMRNYQTNSASDNIIIVVVSLFTLIGKGLVAPFTIGFGLIVMFIGTFLFLWSFVSTFIQFLLGYYNSVLPSSVILSSAVSSSLV